MDREERDRLIVVEQDQRYLKEKVDKINLSVSEMSGKLDALILATNNRTSFERGAVWFAGVIGGVAGFLLASLKYFISLFSTV